MHAFVKNNIVVGTYSAPPAAWRFADGRSTGNFDRLSPSEQIAEGWYPLSAATPAYDPAIERLGPAAYQVFADRVERSHPVEAIPLAELQALKISEVRLQRDKLLSAGAFTAQTIVFARDVEAKANAAFFGAMKANGLVVAQVPVRRADGAYMLLSLAQFAAYAQALHDSLKAIWVAALNHEANLRALTAPADVAAYDVSTGWPR